MQTNKLMTPAKDKKFAYLYNSKKPMRISEITGAMRECRAMWITI